MDIRLVGTIDGSNPDVDDLYLNSHGDLEWVTGEDAIAQHIRIRLRFFKGEWFLNTGEGLPYFQEILQKGTSRARIEALFRKTITGTPGVSGLNAFSMQYDGTTRALTLTFEAQLDEGGTLESTDYPPFVLEV